MANEAHLTNNIQMAKKINAMENQSNSNFKIFPSIGIARVGNSIDEFFIGTEDLNNSYGLDPNNFYKDKIGKVKRQASRFRIYEFNDTSKATREINLNSDDITNIKWNVEIANTKSSWNEFQGLERNAVLRNKDVLNRSLLEIRPTPKTISGKNQEGDSFKFNDGKFLNKIVPLGELKTDDAGRLLVLGGFGNSELSSVDENNNPVEEGKYPLRHYANNDYWHDDISDGVVKAEITFKDGRVINASPSWVIVAPPDFAPSVGSITTLYDIMFEVAINKGFLTIPDTISFKEHIFPILNKVSLLQWVNAEVFEGHKKNPSGDFSIGSKLWNALTDKTDKSKGVRKYLLSKLRNPELSIHLDELKELEKQLSIDPTNEVLKELISKTKEQSSIDFMPPLWGDEYNKGKESPQYLLSITKLQYSFLEKWANGDFESDWDGQTTFPNLDSVAIENQPEYLNKSALEPCVGGGFYPGIEISWISRDDKDMYIEPFRLDSKSIKPGDISKRMAVPWQADFKECVADPENFIPAWWPAQRPDQVLTEQDYLKLLNEDLTDREKNYLFGKRENWDRDVKEILVNDETDYGKNDFAKKWFQMGFVRKVTHNNQDYFIEAERGNVSDNYFENISERDFFHLIVNIDSYSQNDFVLKPSHSSNSISVKKGELIPQVKRLADKYLADTRKRLLDSQYLKDNPLHERFSFDESSFDKRLDNVYFSYVREYDNFNLLDYVKQRPKKWILERIKQMSPFNLTDGAWLQNIAKAGTIDEVQSNLFSVWTDEAGNGVVSQNHSNVYRDLLNSVGIYLPDTNSKAFVANPDLLDSAFTAPVMQLAISLFPKDYLPEIIGMTLYLEWEATPTLSPIVQLYKHYGINPHFYSLHVAIDNISNGHGAIAKKTVQLYLDDILEKSGYTAMQEHWQRIWDGYVCFASTGALGSEMLFLIKNEKSPRQKMLDVIKSKAPIASAAHQNAGTIKNMNELFANPEQLLDTMENETNYIIPGDPDNSPFMKLIDFSGPMYKVFNDKEINIIRNYIYSLGQSSIPTEPTDESEDYIAFKIANIIAEKAGTGSSSHPMTSTLTYDGDTKPINEWFAEPVKMMKALKESRFVKDNSGNYNFRLSPFGNLINDGGKMERVFKDDERRFFELWINKKCPIPYESSSVAKSFLIEMSKSIIDKNYNPKRVYGMGSVH